MKIKKIFSLLVVLTLFAMPIFADQVVNEGHSIILSTGFKVLVGSFGSINSTYNEYPASSYWIASSDFKKMYRLGHFDDPKAKSFYALGLAAIANWKDIEIGVWHDNTIGGIGADGNHWDLPEYIYMK